VQDHAERTRSKESGYTEPESGSPPVATHAQREDNCAEGQEWKRGAQRDSEVEHGLRGVELLSGGQDDAMVGEVVERQDQRVEQGDAVTVELSNDVEEE
jgi:hypothetical protein